jgi:hypothetical protein
VHLVGTLNENSKKLSLYKTIRFTYLADDIEIKSLVLIHLKSTIEKPLMMAHREPKRV